jgi:RNA polymerase sigma factor (sigma-70 family)
VHTITPEDVEYVKRVVRSMAVSYAIGVDDAIGEGLVGLCKAAHDFDGRGRFLGYASRRIVGEVLDAARRSDHLTRVHRGHVKNGDVEDTLRPIYFEDIAARRSSGRGEYWGWESMFGCDEEDIALRLVLDDAIVSIEGRTGAALRLYLLEDMKQVEIAELLGVSASRVSQIISDARVQLREALGASAAVELLG